MRVRCVDNSGWELKLTAGKEYDVLLEDDEYYTVQTDAVVHDRAAGGYLKSRFEVVNEPKLALKAQEAADLARFIELAVVPFAVGDTFPSELMESMQLLKRKLSAGCDVR
jgi:hypothetical protein